MTQLLKPAVKDEHQKKLLVYANSGESWINHQWIWSDAEDACDFNTAFYNRIPRWLQLGCDVVGGCCRVYSEDIARIRSLVDTYNLK